MKEAPFEEGKVLQTRWRCRTLCEQVGVPREDRQNR
jgi:hypothetical protein